MTLYKPKAGIGTQIRLESNTASSDRFLWTEFGDIPTFNGDGLAIVPLSGTISGKLKIEKLG